MDIDEVVETSDVEEMEELQNGVGQSLPIELKNDNKIRAWGGLSYSPPRKRVKTFHATSDSPPSTSLGRLSMSPAKPILTNNQTPAHSRSSSTMRNTDSPSWLSASSRSSQTSIHDFRSPGKQEQENETENSQDPLLLVSPSQKPVELPQTPSRSPLTPLSPSDKHRRPLMMPSLFNSQPTTPITPLFSPLPLPLQRSTTPMHHTPSLFSSQSFPDRGSVQPVNNFEDDELLLFTPSKPASSPSGIQSLNSLSPISVLSASVLSASPIPSEKELSPTSRSVSAPSSPAPPVRLVPQPEPVIDMMNTHEYGPPDLPYSFRKRNPAQIKPYTVDAARYENALKSNPDAIVKNKQLDRHRRSGDHYEHEGETQDAYMDDGHVDEDAGWEEKERRRQELRAEKKRRRDERQRQREAAGQDTTKYPDILQDLSNSDEEEMDAITKEARKAQRRLEKEKRAREKEERRRQREEHARKAKRFPVHKSKGPEASTSSTHHHSATEKSSDESELNNDNGSRTADRSSRPPPSSNNETQIMRDYFGDDAGSDSEINNGPTPDADARNLTHPPSSSNPQPQQEGHLGGDDFDMFNDDPWLFDSGEIPAAEPRASSVPIIIDISDDEEEKPSQPASKVSDIELDLPPQKQRWLRKMYPKSMMKDLTKQGLKEKKSKKADSKRRAVSVASDNDQPLLPGQSRVQRAANPKDIREIKGDSESESDRAISVNSPPATSPKNSDNEGDSDSDVVEILDTYRPRTQVAKKKKEMAIEEIYSSEDEIDDEDIHDIFFPSEEASSGKTVSRLQDESLIDYMLTRWRNIGGARKKKAPPSRSRDKQTRNSDSPRPSKYAIDIKMRGMDHTRQTTLAFNVPEASKKRKRQKEPGFVPKPVGPVASSRVHSSRASRKHASSFKRTSSLGSYRFLDNNADGVEYVHDNNEVIQLPEGSASKPPTWEEKRTARRKQMKKNGVYTNNRNDQYIDSGAKRQQFTSVVEEDEIQLAKQFHLALAPHNPTQAQREHWSKQFKPPKSPPRRVVKVRRSHTADDDGDDVRTLEAEQRKFASAYAVDLHIHSQHAGKSFGAKTDIGKGWLYELVHLVSTVQQPVQPMPVHFSGYAINSDMTLESFCATLPQIIDAFFEFVTALPDPDQEFTKTQWTAVAHGVCQHISWYLNKVDANGALLLGAVESQIVRIVGRVHELSLSFIDTPVMAFGWFAVEMAVRISLSKPTPDAPEAMSKPLKSSAAMLMNLLLQSGICETAKLLQQDTANLDKNQASHYAAELWVCLIHVLSIYLPKGNLRNKSHPFWSILTEVLRSRTLKEEEGSLPVDASENTWRTLFSICALSQFSNHGMASGQPRLPACWDLAVFALKRIRLTSDARETKTKATQQRDAYVAIVVKRCLLLHERWKWNLQDASAMFNALSDIFKSRKFANLSHECGDFADFFKLANWDLLLSYDPKDTAYTVFLKLIVQAAREDPVYLQRKTSPKVKKLLSLAVPLGAVILPKDVSKKESQHNLSMFYNRLSAVAVAVDLDVGGYDDRTSKARTYLDFARSNYTTRLAIIRGMGYWSVMLVARKVKLNAIVDWIQEIATVIEADLKKWHTASASSEDRKEQESEEEWEERRQTEEGCALLFTNFMFGIVRNIIDAHAQANLYPEPTLITALTPLLMSWSTKDTRTATEFRLLAEALFAARSAVLPLPPRPPLVEPVNDESQESQDFGMDDFDDLDWNNVDLPEALAPQATEHGTKDAALAQALHSVHFKWIIGPFLKPFLKPPPPHASRQSRESDCDRWMRLFLSCSSLETQTDKWQNSLRLLDLMMEDKSDESWTVRVHLSIMFQLLKIDPMAYSVTEKLAMQVFMWALVSDHVAIEREYVALFLSVAGLRHPLLHGATLPARDAATGDFTFSSEEFKEARFDFMKIIFNNLNQFIREHYTGQPEQAVVIPEYIGALQSMLSTMRSRLKSLKDSPKRVIYQTFCHRVFSLYQEYPELFTNEHLRFWVNWRTMFTNDP